MLDRGIGSLAHANEPEVRNSASGTPRQRPLGSIPLPTSLSLPPRRMANRQLILQVVQPALAGFMDGSVSTLAPLFATAVATRDARTTFMAGLAAPLVPASQMAFAEALSDDGPITGRGDPWLRGLVEGVATLLGGLAHALPFPLRVATSSRSTTIACSVVAIELLVISWVRFRFHMRLGRSMLQVVAGGALVLTTGIVLGGA